MVKSNKNMKKNNKLSKRSRKNKRSSSKKNMQRGGVSNACVLPYANDTISYHGQSAGANMHNLNPQASLDLDNKFMSYGGPVPLAQMGGANKCGDEGVGTSHAKSNTFKQYLNNLDEQLSFNGGSNMMHNNNSDKLQKGSGYTVEPDEYISGMPVIKGYDDNNPPEIIDGKIVMKGGNKIKKNKKSHKNKKSKKDMKSKTHKKSRKLQQGGDFVSIGSKPAEFSTAFDGPKGVFNYPDNMMTREFGEKQPNYSVNAI